ncbi:DUF2163 domain-containing protein [Hirschia maritima]|uniref:DUF2163 domain-containing protein n=1 Tax=Hirschia maritima TaxID=1121961 RepID=UPI0003645FD5|nr:DUF2163 domain-containing protein [Hirschia maritima]
MKIIEEEFAARLKSGVVTTCLCWEFTRQDGQKFGATDHDEMLQIDDVEFEPDRALANLEFVTNAGLAPGHVSGDGALSATFLNQEDLTLGKWDGAEVKVWRVDWNAPEHRIHVWSGYLGEVKYSDRVFNAELVSLKSRLERRIGRVYARQCDAALGEKRCGVDLKDEAFGISTVISEVIALDRFRIDGLTGFHSGWFSNGMMKSADGRVLRITVHEGNYVKLEREIELSPLDEVQLVAGCNKTFETCKSKFSNVLNFQGFPYLPGMDAVISGPSSGGQNDGGKR